MIRAAQLHRPMATNPALCSCFRPHPCNVTTILEGKQIMLDETEQQLADAADKLQRINNYVNEYTKTNQSLRVQAMIQKIRAIIHGNDK